MFDRSLESDCPATATHPLDGTRSWYLLLDTVHLLKCIRNNWISGESVFDFLSFCSEHIHTNFEKRTLVKELFLKWQSFYL